MCAGASYWSRISRIVYGAEDEKRGYHLIGSGSLYPKTIIIKGILETECAELLTSFFNKKRS
jgi:tRNA(adenine34) deaminase